MSLSLKESLGQTGAEDMTCGRTFWCFAFRSLLFACKLLACATSRSPFPPGTESFSCTGQKKVPHRRGTGAPACPSVSGCRTGSFLSLKLPPKFLSRDPFRVVSTMVNLDAVYFREKCRLNNLQKRWRELLSLSISLSLDRAAQLNINPITLFK